MCSSIPYSSIFDDILHVNSVKNAVRPRETTLLHSSQLLISHLFAVVDSAIHGMFENGMTCLSIGSISKLFADSSERIIGGDLVYKCCYNHFQYESATYQVHVLIRLIQFSCFLCYSVEYSCL